MQTKRTPHGLATACAIVIALISLAGCGQDGLSGTYATDDGSMQFAFHSGSKLTITFSGITQQGTYSVADGNVIYADPQGRGETATIDDNGCLVSGYFGKMCKQ